MSNVRMLIVNDFDTASVELSSGNVLASLPPTNMQIYNNSRVFRTPSLNIVLKGDFADIRLISAFVMWRHNLTAAATIRLELFAEAAQTGAKVYDSAVQFALPQITYGDWDWRVQPVVASAFDGWATRYSQLWFEPVFARSYRLTVSDPVNSAGYIDITRIYMGRHFSPAVNFSYGSQWGFDSSEQQIRTEDGGLFTSPSAVWRKSTFTLDHIASSDRSALNSAIRHVQRTKDWFISLYPDASGQLEIEHSFACKFTNLPQSSNPSFDTWQYPIAVEEC